ncbi:putative Protein anon-37Cs [Hypsibius exemplaris]|uniref:Amine oxidase domain-containing protein n=1 Tax=Hypsibius exemplaris TaxID=2072580 RepID=A0A1W0X6Z1_HYPEX|nr:putative Protein anon-37Cs [Hypsibius exemplaris]
MDITQIGLFWCVSMVLAAFATGVHGKEKQSFPSDLPIIIVGAGAAGLAAAQRLYDSGFRNVTILEALGRTGGRILSKTQPGNHFLEFGGDVIHETGHLLYDFAEKHHLLDPAPEVLDEPFLYRERKPSSIEEKYIKDANSYLDKLIHIYKKETKTSDPGVQTVSVESDRSAQMLKHLAAVLSGSNHEQDQYGVLDAARQLRQFEAVYYYYLRKEMVETPSPDPNLLSRRHYTDKRSGPPNFVLKPTVAMSSVVDNMTSTFPRSWLKLNKPVQRIEQWNADLATNTTRVTVRCSDGTWLSGAHVILTLPLGVMKRSPDLFEPALTTEKLNAIADAGFGSMSKLYVRFPTAFWEGLQPRGSSKFGLIMTEDIKSSIPFTSKQSTVWTDFVVQFGPVASRNAIPNTIWVLIGGPGSYLVDQLSDVQVLNECWQILQKYCREVQVPRPIELIREKWSNNPYFQGTYTFFSVNSSRANRSPSDLALPEWEFETAQKGKKAYSLLFAGEATHSEYFGTIHGALLSGQREADRLKGFYSNFAAKSGFSFFLFLLMIILTLIF